MKSKTLILLLLGIFILGVIKVIFFKSENSPAGGPGQKKGQIVLVTGFIVHTQELETSVFSSGTILANEEVILHPEVQGKLVSIGFKEGSNVSKGTLLAKINDADLQAQQRKLELQLNLAKEKEKRLKGLLEIKGVSQEDYDVLANQLQTIAADLDLIKAQIAKTEIRAPFDGKIGLRNVSEGSYVNSATSIASIQQTDLLKLDFTVPEKYSAIVAAGDKVYFRLQNDSTKYEAEVYALEPRIDEQTRNIMVRAIIKNSDAKIYPGAFARVELIAQKKQQAFMIPTEAVIPELKGKKVFLCKGGKASPVKIKTGLRTDAKVEVIEGLNEGDTLIVTGIMSLKPDATVKIVALKN